MFLTPKRSPRDLNQFPTAQLFLLALVRVAEPIALTSIFPYAWKLVRHYNVTTESNAAFFAGLLISAFSLAEACTGMAWGALSDRIGRKPVLLFGCLGTTLSLLVVGFAPNFWLALLGRLLGGALNGNIGVVQTMVGELVVKPDHQPRAFAVMPFVWSIGTIIGPSIGGFFACPADNFPTIFSSSGLFAKFPYLLPNVICSGMLVCSMISGYFFIEETHPDMRAWRSSDSEHTLSSDTRTPLLLATEVTDNATTDLPRPSYGTFSAAGLQNDGSCRIASDNESFTGSIADEKVFTKQVITFILALGIFTYHSMTYDHLFPIYLQDKRVREVSAFGVTPSVFAGGIGLSTQDVGLIMSVDGLIALFIQAVVFPLLADHLGVWKLTVFVTIGHPVSYFIVPCLAIVAEKWVYPAIYFCLAVRNFFSILAFPLLLILIKESAPSPNHLGRINGLAASTGAAARTVASPIAGLLYGIGSEIHMTPLAWWVSSLVALIGALQVPYFQRAQKTVGAPVPYSGFPESTMDVPKASNSGDEEHVEAREDQGSG